MANRNNTRGSQSKIHTCLKFNKRVFSFGETFSTPPILPWRPYVFVPLSCCPLSHRFGVEIYL